MTTLPKLLLGALVVAFIIVLVITPQVIKLAKKLNLIDDPKVHKHPKVIHTYPVPRGGVLAIFAGIFITSLLFLPLDKHLTGILVGATIVTLMGFLDDKYDLNPYLRLALGFAAATAPIAAGIGIASINSPFSGVVDLSQPQIAFQLLGESRSIWILSDAFALIWIVFMMNMLNMSAKGVDGQLTGTVAIAALVIVALSLKFSADITQWPTAVLAAIIAGAYLGFLPWHVYPQKIMPSYGGSTLAGYFLAVLSILSTTKVGVLVVVLGVPLVDTGYTVVRRLAQGKSPVWGDRKHLHHKLLDSGWSKPKVALFYWLVSAVLGAFALNLNTELKFYTMIGVIIFTGGLILWLTYKPKSQRG